MANSTRTPPHTAQSTDRDRVSILEIVGCAALLSTIAWSVVVAGSNDAQSRADPSALLTTFGVWVAASIAWATLVWLAVRESRKRSAYAWAGFAGAALPAALFGVLSSTNPGAIIVEMWPLSLAMAVTSVGTLTLSAAPRRMRGIVAIIGFLAVLVFYTVAFSQALLGYLQG